VTASLATPFTAGSNTLRSTRLGRTRGVTVVSVAGSRLAACNIGE
jgi:hypothetical protein